MKRQEGRLVSIPKEQLESMQITIETLQDEDVMRQLRESEEDIRKGRVSKARDFLKEN